MHGPAIVSSLKLSIAIEQPSIATAFPVVIVSALTEQSMLVSAGQLMVGAVVSCTVTRWDIIVEFPHSSSAVQLLSMINTSGQLPGTIEEEAVKVTAPQLSVAEGVGLGITASQSTVVSLGLKANTGAVVSITITICSMVSAFPQASEMVHILSNVYS
jgi:hypothetical protein